MIQSLLLKGFPELIHGFSTSHGSRAGEGNMSLNNGDREEVLQNRRRFCEGLEIRVEDLTMVDQVHGARVLAVTRTDRGKGAQTLLSPLGEADALCTDETGVPLTVLVADCPAVFCYDPERRAIGLAHSGWRSTEQGIVPRLISMLVERYACRPECLRVWMSPAIGACCFEVGPEVVESFGNRWPELAGRQDWHRPAGPGTDKRLLDLKSLILLQLRGQGVPAAQIDLSPDCTCCKQDYFSYRRDGQGGGHMMALLAMKDQE